MKKLACLFIAIISAACVWGAALDVAPFARTCSFTLSGYTGASALEGFPVLIRISEAISGFSYAHCAADGADMRFADVDGNLIPHEIETWNTSGESAVWVKVPVLSGSATTVRMYYGVEDATSLPAVTASDVWTKYITVIHGGSGFADSSPKALAVVNGGGVSATAESGIVGGGFSKPEVQTIGVNIPNPVKNNTLSNPNLLSFSAWYRRSGSGTSILASSKGVWGGTGFLLLCEQGTYMSVAVQSTHQGTGGKGALVNGQWAHVGFSYDAAGRVNTYFNGALIYSNVSAKTLSHEDNNYWTVGSYAMKTQGGCYVGDMDEIRFYDGIASADWMKAENDTIANVDFATASEATENSLTWNCEGGVLSARQTSAGVTVEGALTRLASNASSVTVTLKWGVTDALEGGTVEVGEFTAPGALEATFPATTAGATYHFAFVLTPDIGTPVTTAAATFVSAGTGALWRPQTAEDTWATVSWQAGDALLAFVHSWPVTFDGAEQNYIATITVPNAVQTASMTVGGAKDYTFEGAGSILAGEVVKTGTGTMKPGAVFAEPLNFKVLEGTMLYDVAIILGSSSSSETSTVTVGGGDAEAFLIAKKETSFGRGNGASAEVIVKTNGTINVDVGGQWLRLGGDVGGHCEVVVEGGGTMESGLLMFGTMGSTCNATVAGTVVVRDNPLGVGEGSNTTLTLLPGGRIKARGMQMWNNNPTWSGHTGQGRLYVKDGTIELYPVASYGTGTPIINTSLLVAYEDAITFDIPTGGASYLAASPTNVTEGATAHFVKTGGGDLTVTGDVGGITGVIDVLAGRLTFNKMFADDADVTINIAEGAFVGCDMAGGAASILKFIPKDSAGTLILHGNNTNETIDLSEYPNLKVCVWNGNGFNGTLIPYGNHYVFDLFGKAGGLNASVSDKSGTPARITITDSVGGGSFSLAADNSGMSGPIIVSGDARLRLAHPQSAGTGNVTLCEGSSIEFAAAVGANFFQTRVTADSNPAFVFISAGGEACNVDLSRFPECRLGTVGNVSITQTGTVAPRNGEYTLGGGNTAYYSASYTGLRPGTLADMNGPTKAVVDRVGLVNLSNSANTYSGGTVVTNAGRIFVAGDGLGAAPAEFDARNIFIDNGVFRQGNANTTLNINRGIWVGEGGMEFHPWGGYTLTVPGGLGGTGAIRITDGGHLSLTGPYNTYNGTITVSSANDILTIGGADVFSWVSAGGISTVGTVVLNTPEDVTFSDVVSGTGALKKQGAGSLAFSLAQSYTGATSVEAGTLHLTSPGQITSSTSIYNASDIFVDFAGSAKDAFGSASIYGSGTIRFAGGSNTTIDRALQGVKELSAENGATLDYQIPGSVSVTVDNATLALAETAQVSGVENFSDFQLNGDVTKIAENEIQLSPAVGSKGGTAFWKKRVSVTRPWRAYFTYKTVNPNNPADGFAFFVHNDPRGLEAKGAIGGSICASGINPSIGVAYNIYNTDSAGWIVNGGKTDMNTAVGGISIQDGVDVCVTYDGEGKLVQHLFSNGNYVSFTRNVNLLEALGSSTAWVGFSGATGGSICDQRIVNFRFQQADAAGSAPDIAVSDDASKWRINGIAVYEPVDDGVPAFRITDMSNYTSGLVTRLERVYVGAPFKIRGTYLFTGNSANNGNIADGAAIFFHSQSPTAIGATGGSRGVMGNSMLPSATGWLINIYNTPNIAPLKNCAAGTAVTDLGGVNPKSKSPMDFVIAYKPGQMSITLTQGQNTVTVSQEVDLAQCLGDKFGYFSISGGTGGYNARQYVYNLSMETGGEDGYGVTGYGDIEFKGEDALSVAGFSEVSTVKFTDGASVGVTATSAAGTPYTLRADRIEFEGAYAASPSIALAKNGSAAGTLEMGTIAFSAKPQPFKITGAVSGIDGAKVKIEIPKFAGLVRLIDLKDATGLALEDFELVTDASQAELRIVNGVLCAVRSNSTVIFMR